MHFFIVFFENILLVIFHIYQNYQLNIIKKTEEDFKKKLVKRKQARIWLWTLQNLSENEKNKLVEYRKNYYSMKKSIYCNYKKEFWFGKSGRNFQFSGFVNCLMKYKENSVSWNIKGFFGVSVSRNVRKAFFW